MNPLRIITCASLVMIVLALELLTSLNRHAIISIAIIMLFLIIFTYVFQTEGHGKVKMLTIAFSYVGLPLFVTYYLGTYNSLAGITTGVLTIAGGIVSILIMFKLSYVEIVFE